MAARLTREAFATPAGRQRAWRELVWSDHGFLRAIYDNSHVVEPGRLWRSYQPGPRKLAQWRERGVRTVVNLRGDKPSGFLFLEEEACADLGLAHVPFRVFSREAPSVETLKGARDLFRRIDYPALIHCKSGADRAGLMATLYLFFTGREPLDEAMRHLSWRYGHLRQGETGVLDAALEEFIEHARERGLSLSDVDGFFRWAEEVYDPAATRARFRATRLGRLLTERILRRE
ncbi:MAG: tyrosine-protein phosphatase [Parvularculaceae bacterium]